MNSKETLIHPCTSAPLTIRVAYEWDKKKAPNRDPRWQFIKGVAVKVAKEVTEQSKKRKSPASFKCRISRMRAMHGTMLLNNLIKRCMDTDILIFDITENNTNVLFELGVALALKGSESGRVFIFQEVNPKTKNPINSTPSDLQGYFFTRYARMRTVGAYELIDKIGFRAAFRSRLIEIARERGMWSDAAGVSVSI